MEKRSKIINRILAAVLTLIMSLGLVLGCAGITLAADQTPVEYIKADGTKGTCESYTELTDQTSLNGWYVVSGEQTINGTLSVNGDVDIILKDGASLTVTGDGNPALASWSKTVNIYGQEGQSGTLNLTGGQWQVAIGLDQGTVNINGGIIYIKGGETNASAMKAGSFNVNRGIVTVVGGGDSTAAFSGGNIEVNTGLVINAGSSSSNLEVITNPGGNISSSLSGKHYVSITDPGDPEGPFNVYYQMNGHGEQIKAQTGIAKDSTATEPSPAPSAAGYVFKGWYTDAACSEGKQWDFKNPVTSNLFLYAKWVIPYIDAEGSTKEKSESELTALKNDEWITISAGWYLVKKDIEIKGHLQTQGDVHIIVQDGVELTVNSGDGNPGINIGSGSLHIYGQSVQKGQVNVTGKGNCSAIQISNSSSLEINGCIINATGGSNGGAGIGGSGGSAGKNITINGGAVTATGNGGAAGIGGSNGSDGVGENIFINGGTVKAISNGGGVGIGSAKDIAKGKTSSNIKVNKGLIIKTGTNENSLKEVLTNRKENEDIAEVKDFKKAYVNISEVVKSTLTADNFTFTAPDPLVYSGTGKEATVTAEKAVSGKIGDISVFYSPASGEKNWTTTKPINAGDYVVAIDVKEGSDYKAAEKLTADSWKFTITKAEPSSANYTITKPNLSVYDGSAKEVTFAKAEGKETTGAVEKIYYSPASGTENWTETKPVNAGSYKVKIDVAAGDNYSAKTGITDTTWTFEITKAEPSSANYTITKPNPSVYTGSAMGVTFAKAEGKETTGAVEKIYYSPASGTESWTETAPINAGSYKVKIDVAEGSNYNAATAITDATWTFEITRATPKVADFKFKAPDLTYTGSEKAAGVSAAEGITGMGDTITVYYALSGTTNWTKDAPKNVGSYIVKIDVTQGSNYDAVTGLTDASWAFAISRANPAAADFTFTGPESTTYTGSAKEAKVVPADGVTGTGTITKYYSPATGTESWSKNAPVNAGSYKVKIDVAEGDNYSAKTDVTDADWKFTIDKANLSASDYDFSKPGNLVYDGEGKTAAVTVKNTITGSGDVTVYYAPKDTTDWTKDAPKNVGNYIVKIAVAEGSNYNAATAITDATWTFEITRATPTAADFTFTKPSSLTYNGSEKTAGVSAKESITGMGDTITVYYALSGTTDWTKDAPKNVGTYIVKIDVNQGSNYNSASDLTDTDWTFEITRATPTAADFTFTAPGSTTYTGSAKEAKVVPANGIVGMGAITVLYSTNGKDWTDAAPIKAGSYKVMIEVEEGDNYSAKTDITDSETWKFDIEKADLKASDFTFTPETDLVYDGEGKPAAVTAKNTVKGSGNVTVYYAPKDTTDWTTTAPKNAGEYIVKIAVAEGSNYNAATALTDEEGTWKFTIEKAETMTVSGTGYSEVYDGAAHGAAATSNVEVGTTISYSTDDGANWKSDVPQITNVGSVTVKVKAENANYVTANDTYTLAVTAKDLIVTPNSGQSKVYGENDPTLQYSHTGEVQGETADFEGTLSRATGENVGDSYLISKGTLALKDNGDFLAANYTLKLSETSVYFAIVKSNALTVSGENYSGDYDGETHGEEAEANVTEGTQISYSLDGGENWQTNVPQITNVGTKTVSIKAENDNYETAEASYTLEVKAKVITITPDSGKTKVYGTVDDPAFTYTATDAVEGQTADFEGSLSRAEGTDAGTYAINLGTLAPKDNGTFLASNYSLELDETTVNFEITKKDLTILPNSNQSKVYGTNDPSLTFKADGAVEGETPAYTGTLSREEGNDVDTYEILAGNLALDDNETGNFKKNNYNLVFSQTKVYFEITKSSDWTVSGTSYDETYDGSSHGEAAEASVTEGTTVKYSTDGGENWDEEVPQIKDVGTVNVKVKAENKNYNDAENTYTLTVSAKDITVTPKASQSKVYGTATDPDLTYDATDAVSGETAAFEGALTRAAGENAGDYAIGVGTLALKDNGAFKKANYNLDFSETTVNFTITPKDITVTPDSGKSKIYGETDPELTFTIGEDDVVEGETADYTGALSRADGEDVAQYAINIGNLALKDNGTFLADNYNLKLSETAVKFSIEKKELVLTPDSDQTKVYGDEEPTLTYSISATAYGETAGFAGSLSRETGEDVGTYEILANDIAIANNDEGNFKVANYYLTFSDTPVYFEITKSKDLTVSGTSYNETYDGSSHGEAAEANITDGTTVKYSTDDGENWDTKVPKIKDVGTVDVKVKAENNNYEDAENTYTLTVNAMDITVTPKASQSKVYGTTTDPDLTYDATDVVSGETAAFEGALSRETGEDAGDYAIGVGTLALKDNGAFKKANYNLKFSETTVNFTVKQKDITVTPESGQSKIYGETDPKLTFTLGEGDVIEGETADFTGALSRARGEDVSQYAMNKGNLELKDNGNFKAANYNLKLSETAVKFSIEKKELVLTPDSNQAKVYGDKEPTLTYSISETAFEEVAGFEGSLSRETGENAGTYKILANDIAIANNVAGSFKIGNYYLTFSETPVYFTINKADQNAPEGITATDETLKAKEDGTICGVTDKMEYRLKDAETYTAVAKDAESIKDLAAGTYQVRYQGDDNHNPSPDAEAVIKEGRLIDVSFNMAGHGQAVEGQSLKYGDKIKEPQKPSEENYSFVGWYADEEYLIPWDFEEDVVTEDTELFAKWIYREIVVPEKKDEPQADTKALEKVIDKYVEEYPEADSITVKVEVDKDVPENTAKKITLKAIGKHMEAFNVSLLLLVDNEKQNIGGENDELITMKYPFDFSGKLNVQVFREHDGEITELTETANELGEYVKFDKEEGCVYVAAKQYSVYAFTYRLPGEEPATGDFNNSKLFIVIGIIALCVIAGGVVLLVVKKKKD